VRQAWVEPVRSLLEAPAPAVLTTYRMDRSAQTVPVWWTGDACEVVIAKGDASWSAGDVTSARAAIAGRYLGVKDGGRVQPGRRRRRMVVRKKASTGLAPVGRGRPEASHGVSCDPGMGA
jgi:hypothetical protein